MIGDSVRTLPVISKTLLRGFYLQCEDLEQLKNQLVSLCTMVFMKLPWKFLCSVNIFLQRKLFLGGHLKFLRMFKKCPSVVTM